MNAPIDSTNFEQDVLAVSEQLPVVVDFWAAWCGPCRHLGPVIEQLAQEANGTWVLRKVDTDKYPQVSARYGIRGIPAVKMIYRGAVIAEFTGALPRHQILDWLQKNLPNPIKETLYALQDCLLEDPQDEAALTQLRQLIEAYPELEVARVLLAQSLIFVKPDEALPWLENTKDGALFETVEDLRTLHELMTSTLEMPELQRAQAALQTFDFGRAMEALISAVRADKTYADQLPRRATIALFRSLGTQHPLTRQWRRAFDQALY
ncbi:MAG: tetratricopeptide repeat protein [Bernardetiaceae bacterium]